MALDHDAENARVAGGDLRRDFLADADLFCWILAAVAVAEIDHDARGNRRFGQTLGRGVDIGRVVVRLVAAAQDHVAIFVAGGRDDGGVAVFGDRQEMMRRLSGADRVEGDAARCRRCRS